MMETFWAVWMPRPGRAQLTEGGSWRSLTLWELRLILPLVSVFHENMPCRWAGTLKMSRPCTLCPGSYLLQALQVPVGGQQLTLSCFVPLEFLQDVAWLLGGLIHHHEPLLFHPQRQLCHIPLPFLPKNQERTGPRDQG